MSTKQKRAQAKIIWEHYTTISPEKHDSSRGKGWARYQRVSELLLVPKTDDVENVKNEYKTDEGNRKGSSKHPVYDVNSI